MKKSFPLIVSLVSCLFSSVDLEKPAVDYVDPFIGTDGTGHTFPGATLPFGMVQLSPDTRDKGWENCSGYHSSNPTILGFSHTHLSGTGAIDYGDVLVVPMSGKLHTVPGEEENPGKGYRSGFRHETEIAQPGYYAVTLDDDDIRAEVTATSRVGMHRYTFSSTENANILFDLSHGLGDQVLDSGMEIEGPNEISGYRRSTGWAKDQYLFFTAQFSKPFDSFSLVKDNDPLKRETASGNDIKGAFTFKSLSAPLLVKVAISAVDVAGAKKNLNAELQHWNFDQVRHQAREAWNGELSTVAISSGSDAEKSVFYTALYHSYIAPNLYADVDGRYRGADLKIHTLPTNEMTYTVFSLWDTFRATHPLFTLLKPRLAQELVRTLLVKGQEGKLLPVWELAANETGTMIGYHSVPVIVDAYVKGLRDFDVDAALSAMVESAEQNHLGLDSYKEEGYVAMERENESVSKTLEYAYDDWCIAVMADSMGQKDIANRFYRRAMNYQNVYNPNSGFMRGKKFGAWDTPFEPAEVNATFTEANSWQYTFFVPQNINGMMEMMGGEIEFSKNLETLFSASSAMTGRDQPDITGLIGQYAHGNEPSHNFAYLYNFAGQPWKTQELVRHIMDNLYTQTRDGLCGNDDCGQMSSWYVFSALGFYPVTPGRDYYTIGTPLFEKAEIQLENGNTFTILAPGTSTRNRYIQSVKLNDRIHQQSFIRHREIMDGGVLEFRMSSTPNKEWGKDVSQRPKSTIEIKSVATPVFTSISRAFLDSMNISMSTLTPGAEIRYTTDGSSPDKAAQLFAKSVVLDESTIISAVAFKNGYSPSHMEQVQYFKLPYEINITYHESYSHLYTAGGKRGLFDTVRGLPTAWGSWQGFSGNDFFATIDLGRIREIQSVATTFLQNARSWIWLPRTVTFEGSADGTEYFPISTLNHDAPLEEYEPIIKLFSVPVSKPVQYIRIRAQNLGTCPEWHPGAGNPCWLFIDEIVIQDGDT